MTDVDIILNAVERFVKDVGIDIIKLEDDIALRRVIVSDDIRRILIAAKRLISEMKR